MRIRIRYALLAVCAAMALPTAAQAATRSVFVGTPPSASNQFQQYGADVNDYFPHTLTVHKGDKVKFVPVGFHTVEFPAKGTAGAPFFVPAGTKVSGANDANGNAFWFNGLDNFVVNPAAAAGSFGKKVSYNGKSRIESGLPAQDKPKPMTVTFKKQGSFTYICNVHPGMKGKVVVKSKRRKVPSVKAVAKTVKAQVKRDVKIAKPLPTATPPANTIYVGNAGTHGVEHFGFVPAAKTVPVGTTLDFEMTSKSFEAHTATTGPGNPLTEPDSYLGKLATSFASPAPDPISLYVSEQPPNTPEVTPSSHGNGFFNTGVLDVDAATPQPAGGPVKFTAAGTYEFYCLIHPFMHGTITVQ